MRLKKYSYLMIFLFLFALFACGFVKLKKVDPVDVRAKVMKRNKKFSRLFNERDTKKLVAFIDEYFQDDAILIPFEGEMIESKKAVKEYWKSAVERGMMNLNLRTDKVFIWEGKKGDYDYLVYEIGTYSYEMQESQIQEFSGYYSIIGPHRNDCMLMVYSFSLE